MSAQQLCNIFNIAGVAVVLLASLTIMRRPGPAFFRPWVLAYASTFVLCSGELYASYVGRPLWLTLGEVALCANGAWWFYACGRSLNGLSTRLTSLAWLVGGLVAVAWAMLAAGVDFRWVSTPSVVLNSLAYVYLGCILIARARATSAELRSIRWVGWPQLAVGLWIFLYPALQGTPWFWLGFFGSAVLDIVVGVGMVMYLLEEASIRLEGRNQELVQAVQHKQTFLSIVSHELRTPLAAIIGYRELLEDGAAGPLTEEQREYLAHMQQSELQLAALIDSLLDSYQLESGGLRVTPEVMDLAASVTEALGAMQALLTGKVLEVSLPAERTMAYADPQRVVQVLNNLVGNACKFTAPGGHIGVRVTLDGAFVRVTVQDNGIGVPRDQLDKLFEPFFQIDTSLTRRYGGTGLGLSIVRELVTRMGGQVGVESEEGAGSRFTGIPGSGSRG